jgi:indolepyruvate ferredoxin oxidoreductase alpha subunit
MTGYQTHPGIGLTSIGEPTLKIMIEKIAKASGVESIAVVDSYDIEAAEKAFKKMLKHEGVALVISRRLCAREAMRRLRPSRVIPYMIKQDICTSCKTCISFGCPSITWNEKKRIAQISQTTCTGCGVCRIICPVEAIKKRQI